MSETIEIKDLAVVKEFPSTDPMIDIAGMFEIDSEESYTEAGKIMNYLADEISRREEYFGPRKSRAHQTHKDWVEAEKSSVKPFLDAKNTLSGKTSKWWTEQQKKRDEEQAALVAQAQDAGIDPSLVVNQAPSKPSSGPVQKKVWHGVVTDQVALVRQWLMIIGGENASTNRVSKLVIIDQALLDAIARDTKGSLKLPGVEFTNEYRASIRR